MDRLRWDSKVYDEYLAALKKISQCLNEQSQKMTIARRSIMRMGVTAEDRTLYEILSRLEASIRELNAAGERIRKLMNALDLSMDIFTSAEKRISSMGTDLLYLGVMQGGFRPVLVTPYANPFAGRNVTPDWLSQLAGARA